MKRSILLATVAFGSLAFAGVVHAADVNIATGGTSDTVDVIGGADGAVISNLTNNSGAVTGDADTNEIEVSITGGIDSDPVNVGDNSIESAAYGADSSNSIDVNGLGGATANIGNLNLNGGIISASADTNTIEATSLGGATLVDVEVSGNSVSADGTANFVSNSITGDFSDQESTAAPTTNIADGATNTVDMVTTNYSIGSVQENDGTATATADTNTVQILLNATTPDTDTGDFEVDSNEIASLGRGNVGVNTIDGSNSEALNSFGIGSMQTNTAGVNASSTGNLISFNTNAALGATSTASVSNNTIRATAVGNQTINSIRVSF